MDQLHWIKSSRSWDYKALTCVQIAALPGGDVLFRNSNDPDGPTIRYARDELAAFLLAAKDGEFDHLI